MNQREIKFRAWDKVENKMLSWELICINWSCGALKDNFHHVVMQFTGLRDKNGKEIYESDQVKYKDGVYEVRYYENGFYLFRDVCANFDVRWNEVEIIGNIYEQK